MLRSIKSVLGSTILAKDGELGQVHDFLFDDRAWTIRYLVVETGRWLASRRVLLSPSVAGRPDWEKRMIPVDLTMDQVRNSPDVDTARPVSRQQEVEMSRHYGWAAYWAMEPLLIAIPLPQPEPEISPGSDPHLRNINEITAYEVRATDAEIGRMDDLIMEDANWFIPYIVVSTGGWFNGQKLLLSTRSVGSISWPHQQVMLAHSRAEM